MSLYFHEHPFVAVYGGQTTALGGWMGYVGGHYIYMSSRDWAVNYYDQRLHPPIVVRHESDTMLEALGVLEWIKAGGLDEELNRDNTRTTDDVG